MIVREYEKDEVTVHKVPLMLMGGIVVMARVPQKFDTHPG